MPNQIALSLPCPRRAKRFRSRRRSTTRPGASEIVFTSENLQTLLAALGVNPTVREAFAATDRFVLLDARLKNHEWALEVEANACTPEQADDPGYGYFQRGLNWLPHVETHATSLVWDMTRAVLLNPALESDAEPYLDAARKRLGTAEVDRLSREAAADLWRRGE